MYMNDGNKTKINLRNKSVFITGVAGFIGSNLAKRLLSTVEGVKVVGLDNMNHYYDVRLKEARLNELEQFDNFSFVKGNLADKAVIESIFEQYKPEIVVNLGAQAGVRYSITNPDAYVEANLIGFYNILEACRHSYDEGHTPVEHLVYAHERYTVFALHNCTHYYYESQGNEHQTIPHNHFEDMEWHIRLVLEGEDRLVRNLEARESETFSYAADVNPEYNNEMEDPRINVMDFVLNKEFLRKASELLKKHQWEMICRHYIEGMTHREIAAEMGVSHQYVTKGIKKGLDRIRCTYT